MTARRAPNSKSSRSADGVRTYSGGVVEVHQALLADQRVDEATALVKRLVLENEKLTRDLARLRQRLGKKGEGVSTEQLQLLLAQLAESGADGDGVSTESEADASVVAACDEDEQRDDATKPPPPPPGAKTKPARRVRPDRLERRENKLLVPSGQRCCPKCGCEMKLIEFEPSEVIDFQAAQVFVRVDLREKVGCTGCRETVVRAPLGDKVIPGGAYGSALVAELVVGKYRDGLSLHRIREQMQRLGVDIPSATISDQILWATDLLQPIYRQLVRSVVNANLMQLDGTHLAVMHQEKGQPREKFLGILTGAIGDGVAAIYVYASSGHKSGVRDGDIGPEDLLSMRRRGLVLADASNHYDASFKRPELVEVGCNMHARRGFAKALDAGNQRAAIAIRAFKQLYDIEEDLAPLSIEERTAGRQRRSVPIYDELVAWCRNVDSTEPPASLIAVAARYVLNHAQALRRFLEDGSIPIDNGAVERMHRRPAIVRKNMLFAGSHDGARRAAVMFSILATAELLGVNSALYLADVLPRLARGISLTNDLPDLMPGAWLAHHPEASVPVLNAIHTLVDFRDR